MPPSLSPLVSGAIVGLTLSLVGGGGSILAVPLLVHFVGVPTPHVALGTSAVAVTTSAVVNLGIQARAGVVKWRCVTVFGLSGMLGAAVGAALGKSVDGQQLLGLFGLLMIAVGAAMLRRRREPDRPDVRLTFESAPVLAPRLVILGLATGAVSGFFGIGGGFLIVPALLAATRMPLATAVRSSLVAVAAFGLTTALSYASSGLVNWPLASLFVVGGVLGGIVGVLFNRRLEQYERALSIAFALAIVAVGVYTTARGVTAR